MELNLAHFKNNNYFPSLDLSIIKPSLPGNSNAKEIYETFKKCYREISGVLFIEDKEAKALVYTLIYYFQNAQNFFESSLLYTIPGTENSLNKGLIIVGGYGTGKSTCLQTFQFMLNNIYQSRVNVRFQTAIDVVNEYENTLQENLDDFYNKQCNGFRVFDDLKSEKEASRFGKLELFEEILFKRLEKQRIITIILCNYAEECPNNIEAAIEEFSRYGGRVYDRLFGKFNVLRLSGRSYRK